MTHKARLLVLVTSISQIVLLALGWAVALPLLLQLPASLVRMHLLAVGLMLGVVVVSQAALGLMIRWRRRRRPRAEMPVHALLSTLFSSVCAAGVGWGVVFYRMHEPYGLAMPVAALGVGALVGVTSMVICREWLRRSTAKELGDDPALGTSEAGKRSRIGLRGYLLYTLVVLAVGSIALLGAYGYVEAEHESLDRRERDAHALVEMVARRLATLPRSRIVTKLGHMSQAVGVVMRLVDSSGHAVPHETGPARPGVRSWALQLQAGGRCQSRNPGVKRCRWQALDFPYDSLRVVALVFREPPDRRPLVASILAFALALLLFAAFTAHLMGGDAAYELDEVAARIRGVAAHPEQGLGEPIPPTTSDEVGFLLTRFSALRTWLYRKLDAARVDVDRSTARDQEQARYLEEVSFVLRTQLTGIVGHGELLLEGELDGALSHAQQQDVRILLDSARQLLGLVRDLVDVAYAEAGAIQVRPAPVEVVPLVQGQLAAARAGCADRSLTIRGELPEQLDPVVMDEVHIRRVLGNLLSNAVKFTDEGEVVVTVVDEGETVRFAVRDTGPGIAAEHRAVIFEQYRQAPQSRVKQQRGSGLGLAISRQLVQLHGGEMGVSSERGKGSEFWFTLPRRGPTGVPGDPAGEGEA